MAKSLSPVDFNDETLFDVRGEYLSELEIKTIDLWNVSIEGSLANINPDDCAKHHANIIKSWNSIVDALGKYSYTRLGKFPMGG